MSIITNEAYATRSLRRHVLAGMTILGIGCGGFGAWAFGASLHGAVIASGQFVVASEVKKVQHPTGGVVSALFVKEGAAVSEGDVLFLLDETAIKASVQVLSRELFEYAVRTARLIAERDGKETFEARLPQGIVLTEGDQASIVNAERRLFLSRSGLRNGQRALLAARLEQVREEGNGFVQQIADREIERGIVDQELQNLRSLYRDKLVELSRVTGKERERAGLQGQVNALKANLAQSRNKFAEIELQIAQLREDLQTEVTTMLRDIQAKQGEATERLLAAQDQLRRTEVRATASGIVHKLVLHTVGGVLQPGEVALQIVPQEDDLHLDVRIQPSDVDQIHRNQTARVKVQAGHQSKNPEIMGQVMRVSANVTIDERSPAPYYLARVSIPRHEVDKIPGVALMAGMQAETFIQTVDRRPIDFLLKPLWDNFARTMRER